VFDSCDDISFFSRRGNSRSEVRNNVAGVVHRSKAYSILTSPRYANNCEACKILATELQERLTETGKTHEVLEFGYV
jgi:TLR4 regulator and MIR-interacting MSAP